MSNKHKPFSDPWGLFQQLERHVSQKNIKGNKILDIGCGDGWIEKMLLAKGAKHIDAIDINPQVIKKANKSKLKNVTYRVGDATKIPFRKESFDVVVAFEVLEHIPPKTEIVMFREIARVLKPGGHFFLSTPNKHWLVVLSDPAWWLIKHRHYSLGQIKEFLNKSSLQEKRLYVRGGLYTVLLLLSMYVSKWITKSSPIFYTYLLKKSREEFKKKHGIMAVFLYAQKPRHG